MRARRLRSAFLLALIACAGCSSRKAVDDGTPLAFVPADTPYLFANIEPAPEAIVATWQTRMKALWPTLRTMLDSSLKTIDQAQPDGTASKLLQAMLAEFDAGDPATLWQRAGFDMKGHVALYGIDLSPVVRVELADPAAFLALIARIEQKTGKTLDTIRIGEQDVRSFGDEKVRGLLAIEGRHLVIALAPGDANDAFKRRLLGLDRPAKAFDVATFEAFNKAHGYIPYGSGWLDTRRVVALVADMKNRQAPAAGQPAPEDATCRGEFDALAAKAPRFGFGYRALDANGMTMHARLDLEPALAKSLAALAGPLPGGADPDALFDVALSMPVLRLRDFARTQADAIGAAPYQCPALAGLNEAAADAKAKLAQTIPPPLRDFSGARLTLTRLAWPADSTDAIPDIGARFVLGTANPEFLTSLAQVSMPALAGVAIEKDGKPVAIPAAALPPAAVRLEPQVAMGSGALGVSVGPGEAAKLTAAVTNAAPADGTLMTSTMRGATYTALADAMGRFGASLPAQMREQLEAQRTLYTLYAKWIGRVDTRAALTADGVELTETITFAEP